MRYARVGICWCLSVLAVLQQLQVGRADHAPKVQLHERKISEHTNKDFVRQIMRIAKSAEMRSYMLPNVDACENFYEFACGNWPKINPANGVSPRETKFFSQLHNSYNQKQLRMLQEGDLKGDSSTERKAKHFFQACYNLKAAQKEKYKQKLKQIVAQFGQMPALADAGNWSADAFDWVATTGQIQHKYGIDIILQIGIRQDFENETINKLFLGQPTLKLQTKSMYKDEATKWHRQSYQREIKENLQGYLDVEERLAAKTAGEILDFEVLLAEGIANRKLSKSLKSLVKLRTMAEMATIYGPTIDFERFINTALGHELNSTFYEYMVEYQENLVKIIQQTPKSQLANYIFYQLIQVFFVNYEEKAAVREKLCLDRTKEVFAKVLDNAMFRRYNNNATEAHINLMWQKLKHTFREELESERLHWISSSTRKLAVQKLEAMKLEINSYVMSNFSAEFAQLNVSDRDYLENVQQSLKFATLRSIDGLYKPPQPVDAAVILSYSPAHIGTENLIKIPVSLLQPHFLWSDFYPNALKFGTLGYLVAHEIIHGFDDRGCQYDVAGKEKTWWDDSSLEAFATRKDCFKRQYARYRYGGKYLPESELQAENIADNGGVQVAYRAYASWLAEEGEHDERTQRAEQLPLLHYTSRQLFFISFAQFWCNDVNEHFKDKVSLVDVHAPAMFRVIGPLANFDEFSREFQCAKGTTMNPEQKCQIY